MRSHVLHELVHVLRQPRALEPALSADIADYAVDNFSFNNEVQGEAQVGLTLTNYTLSIYAR